MDSYSEHPSEFDVETASAVAAGDVVTDAIGTDERRMHVRAYNYWCSLLNGREFPSIQDLVPSEIEDFGPHSVIVDLTGKLNMPATPFVGSAIKAEIGVDIVNSISDVPGRSLLSRLTDHYFQIVATRAPVGFEAEFVNQRGLDLCYRGILMPFSSDGDTIDFVYGVISWKVKSGSSQPPVSFGAILPPITADSEDEQQILDRLRAEEAEQEASTKRRQKAMALTSAPGGEPDARTAVESKEQASLDQAGESDDAHPHLAWEDGPLADADEEIPVLAIDADAGLADRLAAAREHAEVCKAADGRSRAALYRALAMAYDFAVAAKRVPDDYAEILDDAGVKAQARAPMTPVVKLVFGVDYDKSRLTEFAAALSYAERRAIDFGGFLPFVETQVGGLKALVAAERAERRPAGKSDDKGDKARAALRQSLPVNLSSLPADQEFTLVILRRSAEGIHQVVAVVDDEPMLDRAIRRFDG